MKFFRTNQLAFFAILLLVISCGKKEEPIEATSENEKKSVNVKVVNINMTDKPLPIISSGILSSQSEIKLSFKIGGIVEKLHAKEGQQVRKGQVLARLEQAEINARVTQAKSAVNKAERDLNRVKKLQADSVATLEQVQNATTALEVAKSDLKIAEFNQKYATIYAPTSGKILKKFVEKQELVGPGNPIFFLGSTADAMVMKIGLADKDIVQIKLGDRAEITFDAYKGKVFKAKVTQLAASSDPRTGTFEVELSLIDTDLQLRKGFVGKVKIYPSNQIKHYRLPLGALVEASQNRAYIYVPTKDGQNAVKKMVTPLEIGADFFVVAAEELQGINQVIIDGNMYLVNNAAISIADKVEGIAVK